jgi:hypothetical protein
MCQRNAMLQYGCNKACCLTCKEAKIEAMPGIGKQLLILNVVLVKLLEALLRGVMQLLLLLPPWTISHPSFCTRRLFHPGSSF